MVTRASTYQPTELPGQFPECPLKNPGVPTSSQETPAPGSVPKAHFLFFPFFLSLLPALPAHPEKPLPSNPLLALPLPFLVICS